MEQTHRTHKTRDFSIGCFGWIIVWNLIFVIFWFALHYGPSWELVNWITGIFVLLGLLLPFFLKRNWLGYGVVACVIINALIWIALTTSDFDITLLAIPLPLVLFLFT